MSRLVRHDAQGPYMLKKEDLPDNVAVCGCGLSDDLPHCDGSHKNVRDEEPDVLYRYKDDDDKKERIVVRDLRP